MANKKISAKQVDEQIKNATAAARRNLELIQEESNQLSLIFNFRKKQLLLEDEIIQKRRIENETVETLNDIENRGNNINGNKLNFLKKQREENRKQIKQLERKNNLYKGINNTVSSISKGLLTFGKSFINISGKMRDYFMSSDAAIKSLSLELGLSGDRAAVLRETFYDSAQFAARMGVSVGQMNKMISQYSKETGRIRQFNEENVKAMTLIAKATDLGISGAAEMSAQFEMLGYNASNTANEVQRILDTTERMGVNASNVFKAINKNFKSLQKYTFSNGVKGMSDLAIYAEKFKFSMESFFTPLEKGRSLDSVIEMSAQLQVLGGQFANLSDPLSMLYESRNDPNSYMKRINEMTKGLFTLRKTAEGFNFEIASPMAKDQLDIAAKALGMNVDELTQQAQRMREIQQTRSQMFNKGLSTKEKDMIEGLAKFNTKSGRMFVEIGGISTDVSNLTKQQVDNLKIQTTSLEKRALAAKTFDEAFSNTIEELKATLLPMLNGINNVLGFIRPIMISFTDWVGELSQTSKNLLSVGGMFVAGGMIISSVLMALKTFRNNTIAKGIKGGAGNVRGGGGGGGAGNVTGGLGFKSGLGIGAAGLGIGAGIGVAALGISKLAESMAKLDETQIYALPATVLAIGAAGWMLAPAIGAVGAATTAGSLGLLALGAAALGVTAGIGVMATGIGEMAKGLSTLDKVDLSGIGNDILKIAGAGIGGSFGILGLAAMTTSIMGIASTASDMERVGNAFYNIGAVLRGSSSQFKEVKDAINGIASIDISNNSGINRLTEILSKPLRVQFDDKEIAFVANIDLSVGNNDFVTKITKIIPATLTDYSTGKK